MPSPDRYNDRPPQAVMQSSARFSVITPSDSADLAELPKALWISAGGTLACVANETEADTSVSFGTVQAGTLLPIRPRRVLSTGTTATVIGLY